MRFHEAQLRLIIHRLLTESINSEESKILEAARGSRLPFKQGDVITYLPKFSRNSPGGYVPIAYLPSDKKYVVKEKIAREIEDRLDDLNLSFEEQEAHPDFIERQKICKVDSAETKAAAKRFAKMSDSGTPSTQFEADICAMVSMKPKEVYTVVGPMGADKLGPQSKINPFIAKSSKGYLVVLSDWTEFMLVKR